MRIYYSIDQEGAGSYFLGNFDSYHDATKVAQRLKDERQHVDYCFSFQRITYFIARSP